MFALQRFVAPRTLILMSICTLSTFVFVMFRRLSEETIRLKHVKHETIVTNRTFKNVFALERFVVPRALLCNRKLSTFAFLMFIIRRNYPPPDSNALGAACVFPFCSGNGGMFFQFFLKDFPRKPENVSVL